METQTLIHIYLNETDVYPQWKSFSTKNVRILSKNPPPLGMSIASSPLRKKQSMDAQPKFENVEEFFKEAENTFQKGVFTLGSWSEDLKHLIEEKPGLILAALGVSGFVMGSLLRHGISSDQPGHTLPGYVEQELPADPFVLFVAGAIAGVIAGPQLIQEAIAAVKTKPDNDNVVGLQRARPESVSHGIKDERPFEKT